MAVTTVHNTIILAGNPKGDFREGQLVTGYTPKPGTLMELSAAGIGGRAKWIPWSKSSGAYGAIAVLLEDNKQGQLITTAYADSARIRLYFPTRGEQLYLLYGNQSGTADDVVYGGLLGVETITGKMINNSSYAYPCFTAEEDYTDPTADKLIQVMFNG